MQQCLKIGAESPICFQPFGGGFHDLRLRLKDLSSFPFRQHAHHLTHAPARRAQNLQTLHTRDQQGNALIAHDANAFGIAVEGLEFKTSQVDPLQLFGGIHLHLVLAEIVVAEAFEPLAQFVAGDAVGKVGGLL